jgi:hypothetical protein
MTIFQNVHQDSNGNPHIFLFDPSNTFSTPLTKCTSGRASTEGLERTTVDHIHYANFAKRLLEKRGCTFWGYK